MRRWAALGVVVWLWLAGRSSARAEELPLRTCGFDRIDGKVTISVGLQDLLRDEDRPKLRSGFATRVLLRAYLYRTGVKEPLATAWRRSEIVYDIWDERFRVRSVDSLGRVETTEARSETEAVFLATAFTRFPLIGAERLAPGLAYRVAVRGDLNPLSEERLADVRRWLSRPAGQRDRPGSGDSFFGSFVSVFVNPRIEESEHLLRFLSQPFGLGPRP